MALVLGLSCDGSDGGDGGLDAARHDASTDAARRDAGGAICMPECDGDTACCDVGAGLTECVTLRNDLPEGVGTRHRAAVGITEETDALVIVVSEETSTISVVMGGEMMRGLDGPRLREVITDILTGERRDLPSSSELQAVPSGESREGVPAEANRSAG